MILNPEAVSDLTTNMGKFKRQSYHIAIIILLTILTYFDSLSNRFNIDDPGLLLNNTAVHGISIDNIRKIFASVPNGFEYLPVRDLTYCLDFTLWGSNPFGYHLANLLYYMIACILLYLFFTKVLTPWIDCHAETALFSTLLFAVHPVHVESVAGIAQRKDLVSAIFFFATLYLFLIFKENKSWQAYLLSIVLFIFALLSKATVVMLPILIFLLDIHYAGKKEDGTGVRIVRCIPFALISFAMALIQIVILRENGFVKTASYALESGYSGRIGTAAKAVFYYLRLLITGHPLNIIHDFDNVRHLYDPVSVFALAGLGLIVFGIFKFRNNSPLLSFAGTWYLVCLIPVVGLIPAATVVAERYLFLPSAGFCLAAGYLTSMALSKTVVRKPAFVIFCLLILSFATISHNRTYAWKDALSLYMAGVVDSPLNPRLHWLVGRELFLASRYEEAFKFLRTAKSIDPAYAMDYNVFSAVRAYGEGNYSLAVDLLNQIRLPANIHVRDMDYMYGRISAASGDMQSALNYLTRAGQDNVELGIFYKADVLKTAKELMPTDKSY
jgi:tetratricopeptide (TPR) repeat protein